MACGSYAGIITETEAYREADDLACYAANGKTPYSIIMFGKAGFSYVYFIYGIYHCLNIVAEETGQADAVFIRAIYPYTPFPLILNGPGKLCREWGIPLRIMEAI